MRSVTFASMNQNKFLEVDAILSPFGISVDFAKLDLVELQSDSLEVIARQKAKDAFDKICRPVIVEDDGLFITSLKGFPGQYSSFVFQTLGNEGLLKLLAGASDRSASFRSLIAYSDGNDISIFEGLVNGSIPRETTLGGWGYDPIFIPEGADATFAQLKEEKSRFSHRRKGLEKFAQWLLARDARI